MQVFSKEIAEEACLCLEVLLQVCARLNGRLQAGRPLLINRLLSVARYKRMVMIKKELLTELHFICSLLFQLVLQRLQHDLIVLLLHFSLVEARGNT